jgi:outer membrane protein assembly factor BamB
MYFREKRMDTNQVVIISETMKTLPRLVLRTGGLSLMLALGAAGGDWTTFGHDPQRSGWALEERTLSPENVSGLELKWKSTLKNASYGLSALTAPIVVSNVSTVRGVRTVVYVAGVTGTVFALDAQTGEQLWTHPFRSVVLPGKGGYQGTFLCPNGITATPVADTATGILYVIAPNGSLYGLDLGGGNVRYGPVQFVAPFSKNWSLNLVDGTIHTVLAQGCGGGISGFYSVDVRDPHHPMIRQALLSNTDTAGIWGRGGPVIGNNSRVYGSTADGRFDPIAGDYSNSVVAVSLRELSLVDYYLPPNWPYLHERDLDLGAASPVWFGWKNRNLVASGAKEGVVYLLDADALGGSDHQTTLFTSPKLGNDRNVCCEGVGIWGGLSTARDGEGQTWLFVPMGGPPSVHAPKFPLSNGDNAHGSIMAFKVMADPKTQLPVLEPAWISRDFNLPDPVVIANGVVFALSTGENAIQEGGEEKRLLGTRTAVLYALDAKTGKELYNSGDAMTGWVHFSGLALANGRVFAVDHDSAVYCFGLKGK